MTDVVASALDEAVAVGGPKWGCRALGVAKATWYHRRRRTCRDAGASSDGDSGAGRSAAGRKPSWTISLWVRLLVCAVLCCEEFCESSPVQVFFTLLDRGVYLCSVRTMYRILDEVGLVSERRPQRSYPSESRKKPRLRASGPNQVWTWDITCLYGPPRTIWRLYVVMDIFSRKVVAWCLADHESGDLAARLIENACAREGICRDQLTMHADRGPAMTSIPVYDLFGELGIKPSHSRPYVSDDNPYSESQFKTLKYCPTYPGRFESKNAALAWCEAFFDWYNTEHRHSGIGYHTPASVHDGTAATIREHRQVVLDAAYQQHPQRFRNHKPIAPPLPKVAWINEPKEKVQTKS